MTGRVWIFKRLGLEKMVDWLRQGQPKFLIRPQFGTI